MMDKKWYLYLNKELENSEKRKNASLTIEEWLTFFFVPMNFSNPWLNSNTFYKTERERYEKFGFEKKLRQHEFVRFLGIVFYFFIIVLIINLVF